MAHSYMKVQIKKSIYLIFGFVALILGFIGIFLPILPTTPFLILAAFFFSRSSDRLYRWLLSRPKVGPAIKEWELYRVIRKKAKIWAVSLIVILFSITTIYGPLPIWGKILLNLVGTGVIVFILSCTSEPPEDSP